MKKPLDSEDEQDWPLAPDPKQPPPGRYEVAYRKACIMKRFPDRFTVELHFTVVKPIEWLDTPLVLYCSVPLDRRPARSSKYVELWTLANGAPAKRKDRMPPSVFEGYWIAEVGYTRRRMTQTATKTGIRELGPTETGNAVILTLIERAAGALQKGNQK